LAVRVVRDNARDGDLLPAAIDDRNGGGGAKTKASPGGEAF
jgi:hypothetical protein